MFAVRNQYATSKVEYDKISGFIKWFSTCFEETHSHGEGIESTLCRSLMNQMVNGRNILIVFSVLAHKWVFRSNKQILVTIKWKVQADSHDSTPPSKFQVYLAVSKFPVFVLKSCLYDICIVIMFSKDLHNTSIYYSRIFLVQPPCM